MENKDCILPYTHRVQYYETDKMGITHHSNYIRWMEEAWVAFMEELGYSYERLEREGVISPVISVSCDYKKPTSFPETVTIVVTPEEFKGVKLKLSYRMTNAAGELVCSASSVHCFLNSAGMPVRLNREFPEFYAVLTEAIAKATEQ